MELVSIQLFLFTFVANWYQNLLNRCRVFLLLFLTRKPTRYHLFLIEDPGAVLVNNPVAFIPS